MKRTASTLAAIAIVGTSTASAMGSFPLGDAAFGKDYRKTMEDLYIKVAILDAAFVTLPTFPQELQDIYFTDLVIVYLLNQGCAQFRSSAQEWHPYTRRGISSGLRSAGATQLGEITDRLYRGDRSLPDDECDRQVSTLEKAEPLTALNEKRLWETETIAWMSEETADQAVTQIAIDAMQKKFPERAQ